MVKIYENTCRLWVVSIFRKSATFKFSWELYPTKQGNQNVYFVF